MTFCSWSWARIMMRSAFWAASRALTGSKPCSLASWIVRAAGTLSHDDVDAGVAKVLGVGVALAAIADDGHGFVLQQAQIRIRIIINFHAVSLLLLSVG